MGNRPLILGTRGSQLALRQAQIVQTALEACASGRPIVVTTIQAQADHHPDVPLVALSGEGIFVKELEAALQERRIDIAVHSLKDLPLAIPDGLRIAAVLKRDEPRDALVSRTGAVFDQLPANSRIGTSSARRRSQLLRARRDLRVDEIRGNVDTRLRKLDQGDYDAVVVAACGLMRLGLGARITEVLDLSRMLPEPGQGALAIETRADDQETLAWVSCLDHAATRACVEAERAFLQALGGGCRVPIAAYASCEVGALALEGAVIAVDGSRQLRAHRHGAVTQSIAVGQALAEELITQGALELLRD